VAIDQISILFAAGHKNDEIRKYLDEQCVLGIEIASKQFKSQSLVFFQQKQVIRDFSLNTYHCIAL